MLVLMRIDDFRAKDGKADALRALLTQVIPSIASLKGCLSCKLLQSQDTPSRFVVLEVWDSVDSHKAAGEGYSARDVYDSHGTARGQAVWRIFPRVGPPHYFNDR